MNTKFVVIISADAEWEAMRDIFPKKNYTSSPYGKWFYHTIKIYNRIEEIIFFHTGCGKVAAAASTQYVIDKWDPTTIINLGTCGGIKGESELNDIILVNKTIIYDIIEEEGEVRETFNNYITEIDLSFIQKPYPTDVKTYHMLTADRDLRRNEVKLLKREFKAKVADWESGAIAYVLRKNNVQCLILRGVSDIVSPDKGEIYGNSELYKNRVKNIMTKLVQILPSWMERILKKD